MPYQTTGSGTAIHSACVVAVVDFADKGVYSVVTHQPAGIVFTAHGTEHQPHILNYGTGACKSKKSDIVYGWPINGQVRNGVAQAIEGARKFGCTVANGHKALIAV